MPISFSKTPLFSLAALVASAFLLNGCGGGGSAMSPSRPAPSIAAPTPSGPVLRLACVGDSITFGLGVDNPGQSAYPAVLKRRLGNAYQVASFGRPSATLLRFNALPYREDAVHAAALEFKPDVVVIALGTNDAFILSPERHQEFLDDLSQLIADFRASGTTRFYLCVPPFSPRVSLERGPVIETAIAPLIQQVATQTGSTVIDLFGATQGHPGWFPDGIHPNEAGARAIALEIQRVIGLG